MRVLLIAATVIKQLIPGISLFPRDRVILGITKRKCPISRSLGKEREGYLVALKEPTRMVDLIDLPSSSFSLTPGTNLQLPSGTPVQPGGNGMVFLCSE